MVGQISSNNTSDGCLDGPTTIALTISGRLIWDTHHWYICPTANLDPNNQWRTERTAITGKLILVVGLVFHRHWYQAKFTSGESLSLPVTRHWFDPTYKLFTSSDDLLFPTLVAAAKGLLHAPSSPFSDDLLGDTRRWDSSVTFFFSLGIVCWRHWRGGGGDVCWNKVSPASPYPDDIRFGSIEGSVRFCVTKSIGSLWILVVRVSIKKSNWLAFGAATSTYLPCCLAAWYGLSYSLD